jgi:hypothetical protein
VYDTHIQQRWTYENGLLVSETKLTNSTYSGQMFSWGADYTYDELGREIFREENYDPWLGGIPNVTHVHSTYDPSGFLKGEVWQFMEWANPDNVVIAETHKNYTYCDDGQLTRLREDYFSHGEQSPIDWREETWTYTDFGKVASHVVEDYNFFNVPVSRFYTYNANESLRTIRLQDEIRFGDDRPRVVESFSYNKDGSMKEQTLWGTYSEFGYSPWTQIQFTHTSPGYDKTTKLIDLTGDFKFEFKVVTDVWRNDMGQDTHTLVSRYDAGNNLLGRDLVQKGWDGDFLAWETRDLNIHDGVVEFNFTSEWLMVA